MRLSHSGKTIYYFVVIARAKGTKVPEDGIIKVDPEEESSEYNRAISYGYGYEGGDSEQEDGAVGSPSEKSADKTE